jgi:hypothetical protein
MQTSAVAAVGLGSLLMVLLEMSIAAPQAGIPFLVVAATGLHTNPRLLMDLHTVAVVPVVDTVAAELRERALLVL